MYLYLYVGLGVVQIWVHEGRGICYMGTWTLRAGFRALVVIQLSWGCCGGGCAAYNAARSLAESTQCSLYHFVHIRVGSVRIVFTHYRRHGVFNTRFLLRCPTRAVGDSQHFAVPFSADLMLNWLQRVLPPKGCQTRDSSCAHMFTCW